MNLPVDHGHCSYNTKLTKLKKTLGRQYMRILYISIHHIVRVTYDTRGVPTDLWSTIADDDCDLYTRTIYLSFWCYIILPHKKHYRKADCRDFIRLKTKATTHDLHKPRFLDSLILTIFSGSASIGFFVV